jgi:hypothetical protein
VGWRAEMPGCAGVAGGRMDRGDYEERHTEKEELGVARSRRATGGSFFFPIAGGAYRPAKPRVVTGRTAALTQLLGFAASVADRERFEQSLDMLT